MDLQKIIDSMNESSARTRSSYHLTYGGLIEALEKAPSKAKIDKRIKGIGSWRGSYIEIAIFTDKSGLSAFNDEFNGDYKDYDEWLKTNCTQIDKLPTNANELGKLLRSLIGKDFVGYKGGNFRIEEYKPLWLCTDSSNSGNTAIIGIDDKLKLITKETD
jgi:hypothetical protein